MQCPHCNAELKYTERSWHTCSKCKQRFALDPKYHPLSLHDLLFKKIIDQMGQGGQFFYTADQLRHRAARKVAASRKKTTPGAALFFLLFLALLVGAIGVAARGMDLLTGLPLLLFIVVVVVFGSAWVIYKALSPFKFSIPMELARFEHDVINRWQKIYGARPAGLIDQQVLDRHPEHRPPPAQVQAVVACTARDVLLSLRANGVPERLNVQLIPTKEPFTATQQATVERLREHPELPLLLLHDASPQGCLLHQTIRQSLQLRAYHTVVDVGLHPSDAISQNMMRLGAPPPKPVLEILKQRVGMDRKELARTAGLAARPLSQAEFKWLEDGYYTPILYVPPARLIKVLVRTLQRLNLATPATSGKAALPADPDPEEEPQRAAEQVGFMSWPTA